MRSDFVQNPRILDERDRTAACCMHSLMGPPPQTNAVFAVGRGDRTERTSRGVYAAARDVKYLSTTLAHWQAEKCFSPRTRRGEKRLDIFAPCAARTLRGFSNNGGTPPPEERTLLRGHFLWGRGVRRSVSVGGGQSPSPTRSSQRPIVGAHSLCPPMRFVSTSSVCPSGSQLLLKEKPLGRRRGVGTEGQPRSRRLTSAWTAA